MKKSVSDFFVAAVQKNREQKIAPADIWLSTKLPELQNATPAWIINVIEYFNTLILKDGKLNSISISSWKNCQVQQWNLSYECITLPEALTEWFKLSADIWARIKRFQSLLTDVSSSTVSTKNAEKELAEDVEEDSDGSDDENVPLSLSSAQVVGGELDATSLSSYQTVGRGIFYNEDWDEKAQLVEEAEWFAGCLIYHVRKWTQ